MLEAALALSVPAAVSLPYLLPLQQVSPRTASAIWLLSLWLRALVTCGVVIFVLVYLPQTQFFDRVAHWCLEALPAILSSRAGLSGHPLAHFAVVVPALAVAASVLWMLAGLARAWIALRVHLARRVLGVGPGGAMVVDDDAIVVAVTRFGRGRVVVSRAALGAMDEQELAASLAHEEAHLSRRHRPVLLLAALLAAVARHLPGTRAAYRGLVFSLERDADEHAVEQTRDPLALASAIGKAATGPLLPGTAALGGDGGVCLRMTYLLDGGRHRSTTRIERVAQAVAGVLACLVLGLSLTLPAWAVAAPAQAAAAGLASHHCPH